MASINFNCNEILYNNINNSIIQRIKLPLTLLITLLLAFYLNKDDKINYVIKYFVPILVFIFIFHLLDRITIQIYNNQEMRNIIKECKTNKHNINSIIKYANIEDIKIMKDNYNNNIETFNTNSNNINDNDDNYDNDENVFNKSKLNPLEIEVKQTDNDNCLLGKDSCSILCSGNQNNCNVVAPIPGPQWQVKRAHTVQEEINNNQFTKNKCI